MANPRKERAAKLFKSGLTKADVGRLMGVSRQRAHQLITGYKSPAHRRAKGYKEAA